MDTQQHGGPVEILLVEDRMGDVRLTLEALKEIQVPHNLNVIGDGDRVLPYLRRETPYEDSLRPDLILLDLNLPTTDGREVLRAIKGDPALRTIPVIILTTSSSPKDIQMTYDLQANCYVTKPADLDQFLSVVKSLETFWLSIVKLPSRI